MQMRKIWPSGWRGIALIVVGIYIGATFITPAVAHVAGWTHNWTQHIRPKTDARYYTKSASDGRYLPGNAIPQGKTVRGSYWMGGTAAAASGLATSEVEFGWTFAGAPTGHFIQSGGTPPAECPGTSLDPQAAPGHLCIYEHFVLNAGGRLFTGPGGDGSTWPYGAGLFIRSAAAGDFYSLGTWAATSGAPVPMAPSRVGKIAGRS